MKKLLLFLFFFTLISAKEWELKDITFVTENDADFRTDRDYTYGSELSILFLMESNKYFSFSIAHQMFTPKDFDKEDVNLSDQRPYAGYAYISTGYHEVSNNTLLSYTIDFGFVGESVQMDKVQKIIHSLIGSPKPKGWDEQVKDEFIFQVNIEKRWFYELNNFYSYKTSFTPYVGTNLGNCSTKAVIGSLYRISNKNIYNFGSKRIDYRSYNNIPLKERSFLKNGYYFSFYIEGNIVARDIFLDGNSFKDSVFVDKEIFVAKGGFGIGYIYKNFELSYLHTVSSKEFKMQDYYHGFGSFLISYHF